MSENPRDWFEGVLGNTNIGLPGAQRYLQPNEIKELMRTFGALVDALAEPNMRVIEAAENAYGKVAHVAFPSPKGLSSAIAAALATAVAQAKLATDDAGPRAKGAIQSAAEVPGTDGKARSISVDSTSVPFRPNPR